METVDALRARILAEGKPLPDAPGVWMWMRPGYGSGEVSVGVVVVGDVSAGLAWSEGGHTVFSADAIPDARRYLMVASR